MEATHARGLHARAPRLTVHPDIEEATRRPSDGPASSTPKVQKRKLGAHNAKQDKDAADIQALRTAADRATSALVELPRTMRRPRCINPRCALRWVFLFCALALAWQQLALHVCNGCYRVGNYLDFWMQKELMRAASDDAALSALAYRPAASCDGIVRQILLKRKVHMRSSIEPITLIERVATKRLLHPPPPGFWSDASRSGALRTLLMSWESDSDAEPVLWWHAEHMRILLPYLQPSMHALVEEIATTTQERPYWQVDGSSEDILVMRNQNADRTCVVHFFHRPTDSVVTLENQRSGSTGSSSSLSGLSSSSTGESDEYRLSIATLIAAASTFPEAPKRFELLGGGLDPHCDPSIPNNDCGAVRALRQIAHGLRRSFPEAAVVILFEGDTDSDFVRAARAPMLLLGADAGRGLTVGSSYSMYAAIANARGLVRTPACFLRVGPCMEGLRMSPRWVGYRHPSCTRACRAEEDPRSNEWARVRRALEIIKEGEQTGITPPPSPPPPPPRPVYVQPPVVYGRRPPPPSTAPTRLALVSPPPTPIVLAKEK